MTWIPAFAGMTIASAFQLDSPQEYFLMLEAGQAGAPNVPKAIALLGEGRYSEALEALDTPAEQDFPWLRNYLEGLIAASADLARHESEHFTMFTPPGQGFLADYALPSLEQTADHFAKVFGHRPRGKIRIEIYPNKETFSAASTLTEETLKRSGAIGICKFHRLMILSPGSLPLGYRWMDALAHEYLHLLINEMSGSRAELWLHEGTARYFETAARSTPPLYLTPDQKTKLLEAREKGTLIPFSRMSPSLVYLKDQEEVSLAFSQVAYAIQVLVREQGMKRFSEFLNSLKTREFAAAFVSSYRVTPPEFERYWQGLLAKEDWEKSKGTMSDEVRFGAVSEQTFIGADAEGQTRLGDRMRQRGLYEAALIEYEKALKEEPDNAVILLKGARMHLALSQPEKAVEKLRRATAKNPNYGTPHIELAKLVGPEEALPHLLEANAINPFNPEIHELLGKIYETLGQVNEAAREKQIKF